MRTLVAYVPVLHEGYRRFFAKYDGPKELYVLGPELIAEFPWLAKEIRQLEPSLMSQAVAALGLFERVSVLTPHNIQTLNTPGCTIVMPSDDVSQALAVKYFPNAEVIFDAIFLRWDKHNTVKEKPVVPDEHMTRDAFHRGIMKEAEAEAAKSSDNWRHVGAIIVKDGSVLLSGHNHHLPSPHTPYVNGDPRNNFHKGDHIELSSAFHAEASLVAEAAKRGLKLEGAEMYVTTFPCPPCAKVVAGSGIKTLYYAGGYGVLDGEDILKAAGVKIVFVD